MKQARLFMGLMLLATMILSPSAWAEGDKASGKLKGWHAFYAKELNMTDEQIEQYKQMLAKREAAEAKWKSENKEKYEAAKKAVDEAKASGDKAAYKQAKEAYYAAKKDKDDANKAYEEAFEAMLTPEQKGYKIGLTLYNSVKWTTKKADLSSEQEAKIKEMAIAEGATLKDAKGKELHQAKAAFKEKVISEVLTAEQREALGNKGKGKPEKAMKEKKEKKEKAPKAKKEKKDKE